MLVPVFEALIGDMPAIITSYSKPSRGLVTDDMAEYAIMRYVESEGDTQVFFIYSDLFVHVIKYRMYLHMYRV